MRWEGQRESQNIEDRRGMGAAKSGMGLGLGGIVLVLAVSFLTGTNPLTLLNILNGVQDMSAPSAPDGQGPTGPPHDGLGKFASVVLADTEDTWRVLLPRLGGTYEDPQMVLFTGAVRSACGTASSAVGPFYCPADHKVYLDLVFFEDLHSRFGASGDIAPATTRSTWTSPSSTRWPSDSARRATSRRPMSSHMRSATMSRTCLASPTKSPGCSNAPRPRSVMPCRCGWNYRPIVLQGSGGTMRNTAAT